MFTIVHNCTLLVNTVQAFLIKFPHGQWSYKVLELYLVAKHNTSILKKWGLSRVMVVYYTKYSHING